MVRCVETRKMLGAAEADEWLWVVEGAYLEVLLWQEDDAGQIFLQLPGHVLPLWPRPIISFVYIEGLLGNPSGTSIWYIKGNDSHSQISLKNCFHLLPTRTALGDVCRVSDCPLRITSMEKQAPFSRIYRKADPHLEPSFSLFFYLQFIFVQNCS